VNSEGARIEGAGGTGYAGALRRRGRSRTSKADQVKKERGVWAMVRESPGCMRSCRIPRLRGRAKKRRDRAIGAKMGADDAAQITLVCCRSAARECFRNRGRRSARCSTRAKASASHGDLRGGFDPGERAELDAAADEVTGKKGSAQSHTDSRDDWRRRGENGSTMKLKGRCRAKRDRLSCLD